MPPYVQLVVNYYHDKSGEVRQQEIIKSLLLNARHPAIDMIKVIVDNIKTFAYIQEWSPKIHLVHCAKRPMFGDYYRVAHEAPHVPTPDTVTIISNSDISFDDTLTLAFEHLHPKTVWALSRDDAIVPYSQDSWWWKGSLRVWPKVNNYFMGIMACDLTTSYQFQALGYQVVNPSHSVKTYHHHASQVRHYHPTEYTAVPWLGVPPSSISQTPPATIVWTSLDQFRRFVHVHQNPTRVRPRTVRLASPRRAIMVRRNVSPRRVPTLNIQNNPKRRRLPRILRPRVRTTPALPPTSEAPLQKPLQSPTRTQKSLFPSPTRTILHEQKTKDVLIQQHE